MGNKLSENKSEKKVKSIELFFLEKSTWVEYALVLALIVFFFLLRRNFVGIPMERDEGTYIMYGKFLLGGAKPYLDFYDMKPPGVFIIYAMMVKIFGYSYLHIQEGFCFVYALILFVSWLFFRSFIGKKMAMLILPVYGFMLLNESISGFTVQSEFFVILFALTGLCFFQSAHKKNDFLLMLLAGVFLGFTVLIKQVAIFYFAFGMVWIIADGQESRNYKKALFELSAFALGGFVIFSAAFIWLLMQSVLSESLFWIVEFPRKYYLSDVSFWDGMEGLYLAVQNIMYRQTFFWLLLFAGVLVGFFIKMPVKKKILIYSFFVLTFLTVVPGLRFYSHYWISFIPGAVLAIAMFYRFIEQQISKYFGGLLFLAILFISAPLIHFTFSGSHYLKPNFDQIMSAVYGDNLFPDAKVVSEYLKRNMDKEDQLFVGGSEPEIYLYTNNTGISKHILTYYMNMGFPFARKMREEAIHDIETGKPRFIVFPSVSFSWWMFSPDKQNDFHDWCQKYLSENYKMVFVTDQVRPNSKSLYVDLKEHPDYKIHGQSFVAVLERNKE